MAKPTPAKESRNKQVVVLRLAGMTYADIGRKFNISRAFAKAIFDRDLPKYKEQIVSTIDKARV